VACKSHRRHGNLSVERLVLVLPTLQTKLDNVERNPPISLLPLQQRFHLEIMLL